MRKKGHMWNVINTQKISNISVHTWCNKYSDFINASVIDKLNYFLASKALESWHTANTNKADNNVKSRVKQYFKLGHSFLF